MAVRCHGLLATESLPCPGEPGNHGGIVGAIPGFGKKKPEIAFRSQCLERIAKSPVQ